MSRQRCQYMTNMRNKTENRRRTRIRRMLLKGEPATATPDRGRMQTAAISLPSTSSQCLEHGIQSTDKHPNVSARLSVGESRSEAGRSAASLCGRSVDNESETLKRRRHFGCVHLSMTCESIFVVVTARPALPSTSTRRPSVHGERRQEAGVTTTVGGPSISHNRRLNELQRSWECVCFSHGECDVFW